MWLGGVLIYCPRPKLTIYSGVVGGRNLGFALSFRRLNAVAPERFRCHKLIKIGIVHTYPATRRHMYSLSQFQYYVAMISETPTKTSVK